MTCLAHATEATRVLAFGAHPDDLEVGAGGLLSRLAARGVQVTAAVVSLPTLTEERTREALAGAKVLGAKLVILNPDRKSRVEDIPMHQLVAQMDTLVNDIRPDLVITHSAHDLHWDHGLVNRATVSALRRLPCNLLAYVSSYEMNAQNSTRAVGQCFADISDTIERKVQAIAAHASQLPKMDLDSTRDLARAMGRLAGVQFAEAYEVLRLRF
ncbi:MAG TPA: PIG-L deacetylase family protein [Polyangia bacterium]|nr:PIG-L deacetylase family protein [Polyangia bacterium]